VPHRHSHGRWRRGQAHAPFRIRRPVTRTGRDADEVIALAAGPRLHARGPGRLLLILGVEMVSRSLDQDAPAFPRRLVEMVNVERHPVLAVLDPRAQVLLRQAALRGAEQDGTVGQLVVDQEDGQVVAPDEGDLLFATAVGPMRDPGQGPRSPSQADGPGDSPGVPGSGRLQQR